MNMIKKLEIAVGKYIVHNDTCYIKSFVNSIDLKSKYFKCKTIAEAKELHRLLRKAAEHMGITDICSLGYRVKQKMCDMTIEITRLTEEYPMLSSLIYSYCKYTEAKTKMITDITVIKKRDLLSAMFSSLDTRYIKNIEKYANVKQLESIEKALMQQCNRKKAY